MGKIHVIVDLPNASDNINGVPFKFHEDGEYWPRKITVEPPPADVVANFLLVPGFSAIDLDPAAPVEPVVPPAAPVEPAPIVYPDTATMVAAGYSGDALKNASDYVAPPVEPAPVVALADPVVAPVVPPVVADASASVADPAAPVEPAADPAAPAPALNADGTVKRPRGRPRKVVVDGVETSVDDQDSGEGDAAPADPATAAGDAAGA